ncbi:hypothetical protein, partial [Arthrobacter sp. ISL-28]|uniref:hypothetical protein n=1 Tax=Arthrobacter sp. ISL-28 TaxID=2819108 RepID=UPI001BE5BAF0
MDGVGLPGAGHPDGHDLGNDRSESATASRASDGDDRIFSGAEAMEFWGLTKEEVKSYLDEGVTNPIDARIAEIEAIEDQFIAASQVPVEEEQQSFAEAFREAPDTGEDSAHSGSSTESSDEQMKQAHG